MLCSENSIEKLIDEGYFVQVEIDTVRLNLQYAPRVRLSWANPGRLREGAPALLACNVDARPLEGLTITWFRNENKLSRHTTDVRFLNPYLQTYFLGVETRKHIIERLNLNLMFFYLLLTVYRMFLDGGENGGDQLYICSACITSVIK